MAYTTKCENSVIASICSTHAVMKDLTLFGEVKRTLKHAPGLKLTKYKTQLKRRIQQRRKI